MMTRVCGWSGRDATCDHLTKRKIGVRETRQENARQNANATREHPSILLQARHQSNTTFPASIHPQQFCSGSTTSQARSFRHWSPCRVAGDWSKHQVTAEEKSGPCDIDFPFEKSSFRIQSPSKFTGLIHSQQCCNGNTTSRARSFRH
jgi:hypothetical protein